jgi:ribosomal protein L18
MAIEIVDEVIQTVAIEAIHDELEKAQQATGGAISLGKNIHKGDFKTTSMFANLGEASRRDPNTDVALTAKRLGTADDTAVKLYFNDLVFATNTELERYGTTMGAMNVAIGRNLGQGVARWAIKKGLISLVASIGSEAGLIEGDHTGAASVTILNNAVFKLGDQSENVKVFVAPSAVTHALVGSAIGASTNDIAYGAVYDNSIGTLGRGLWTVDAVALTSGGNKVLGLTPGAVTIDESEVIKMVSQLVTGQSNLGYNFQTEGAYTIDIKGFKYVVGQGANPTDAVLGATASWSLIDDIKAGAGVLAKVS